MTRSFPLRAGTYLKNRRPDNLNHKESVEEKRGHKARENNWDLVVGLPRRNPNLIFFFFDKQRGGVRGFPA